MIKKFFTISALCILLSLIAVHLFAKDDKTFAYLGVSTMTIDERTEWAGADISVDEGIWVTKVYKDTPAEKAGIKKSDIITHINGKEVLSSRAFSKAIRSYSPGTTIDLTIIRDKKTLHIKPVLTEHKERSYALFLQSDNDKFDVFRTFNFSLSGNRLGVKTKELDGKLAAYFHTKSGLLVLGIAESSAAAKAGIEEGDVIKSINGKDIKTRKDAESIISKIGKKDVLTLDILRKGKELKKKIKGSELKESSAINIFMGEDETPIWIKHNASRKATAKIRKITKDIQQRLKRYKIKIDKSDIDIDEKELYLTGDRHISIYDDLEKKMRKIEKKLEALEKKLAKIVKEK